MLISEMYTGSPHRMLDGELIIAVDGDLTITERIPVKHIGIIWTRHLETNLFGGEDLIKSDTLICRSEVRRFLGDPLPEHGRLGHIRRITFLPLIGIHLHRVHDGVLGRANSCATRKRHPSYCFSELVASLNWLLR